MYFFLTMVAAVVIGWIAAFGGFDSVVEKVADSDVVEITAPIDAAREAVGQIELRASAVVDQSHKGLTEVPQSIFANADTTSLDLSGNSLSGSLPAEIRLLTNLRVLNLSNNNFTGVPAEVGQLARLEVLDLSYNPITGLPLEIGNLKNLKTLNLRGTEYSIFDLERITDSLPATVRILTE